MKVNSNTRTALVIGAAGLVGKGIVRALVRSGWSVIAVGRDQAKLRALQQECRTIHVLPGSVADEVAAGEMANQVRALSPSVSAVVTSVNLPLASVRLVDQSATQLTNVFQGNLLTHHIALRATLPLLAPGGRYVGIGGGMADYIAEGMGPVSICQAAQRNLFKFYALETAKSGVSVVELMLLSMIADSADDLTADPRHIRANEAGEHVRAVLEKPEQFPGPILALKSRKQIGQPERTSS